MSRHLWLSLVLSLVLLASGCGQKESSPSPSINANSQLGLKAFTPRSVGLTPEGNAWITDVEICDLDGDGKLDIIACDGRRNEVYWLRQVADRQFEEQVIASTIRGPAHLEVIDVNGDKALDVLVAGMGDILPSNAKTGTVAVLENRRNGTFEPHVLLQDVSRVTYVGASDFNKDGRMDLVVGQFGYLEGEIRWLENKGEWNFESHWLLAQPGTIHAPPCDLDGDGNADIVALVAQDSEEVHWFKGNGAGQFEPHILYGSTNTDFGSSGLTIADLNRDGRPDIVYTNGDGFDYITEGGRPWHGVQWLENLGDQKFRYRRLGDFPGAFSPAVFDLDHDGDLDVVVSCGFNDWKDPNAVGLAVFEQGPNGFVLRPLTQARSHLVVVRVADLFGDGRPVLVTGAMAFYPPYDRASRITVWEPGPR